MIIKLLHILKNTTQFQKGQRPPEFLESYGNNQHCEDALFQAHGPNGFQCRTCGDHKSCCLRTRQAWQCMRCKRRASLTADTLFDNTELPLRTWFLTMYWVPQSKDGMPSVDLKRQLGVSDNTAWVVKHKLMQAMWERDDSQPLHGTVGMDGAYLGVGERWYAWTGPGRQDAVRGGRAAQPRDGRNGCARWAACGSRNRRSGHASSWSRGRWYDRTVWRAFGEWRAPAASTSSVSKAAARAAAKRPG